MEIKIDTKILNDQILLLDSICNFASLNKDHIDLIDGITNLLSELSYATSNCKQAQVAMFVSPVRTIPNGHMTIRELMGYEIDIDIANNVTDSLGCCLVCPTKLTEEGEREWGDVLDYVVDVYGDDNYAECIVDDDHNIKWQTKKRRLDEFLASAAGYCSEYDYNKWFMD